MKGDPFIGKQWNEDPWDSPAEVPESSTETLPPEFDHFRGPLKMVATIVVASVLLLGAAGWWIVNQLNPSGEPGAAVNFTVNEGDTVTSVASRLESEGFIENATIFRWYASTRGGIDLLPGYYSLRPKDNAGRIIKALSTPPAQTFVSVTFPEGMTLAQMGERLASKLTFMSIDDFLAAAQDGSVVSEFSPEGQTNLEGLLFPDTYQVSGDGTEAGVVKTMAEMMQRVARQTNLVEGAKALGLTPYELLIVASMVEREAKVPEDRAKIAQVIYNRLAADMNLEIDAAVKYGQDPSLSWLEMKEADTAYNVYRYKGLPPTPIANPGRASIVAALTPAGKPPRDDEACVGLPTNVECQYLYYVLADKSGRHVFATTYEQHLVNVEKSRAAGILP
ncbi:MAG: hypothetical protein RIR69_1361 [Actinomycetota bacterium]|jgi:UPF0755 protein